MGYQLWLSNYTGLRRKGTTFKELEAIFIDQITTKFIAEPLFSCRETDESHHVKEELIKRDFDYVGVIDEHQHVIGFCKSNDLNGGPIKQYVKPFLLNSLISDSTPICKLLSILRDTEYTFVLTWNQIAGIVTIWDINKPVIRIYLFGIISLFELHINYWIDDCYPGGTWTNKLKQDRIDKAKKLLALRQGNNNELTLLECLQLSDKRNILHSTPKFLLKFGFSKKRFESVIRRVEIIRNEIAHSQNSIISNLAWKEFVDIVTDAEKFLKDSECKVEEKVLAG